jgi:hypothetical protein
MIRNITAPVLFLFSVILFASAIFASPLNAATQTDKKTTPYRAIVFWPEGVKSTEDFLDNFEIFVRNGLVPQGINTIVFDMHWNNYQFTSVPELNQLGRMPRSNFKKSDAKKMVEICKTYNINVMVGMNFLTHQNYGQLLKAFPEYTWPGTDNLWDPLNPEVNKVVFKMVDELIDAFSPVAFHIGMDEGWGFDADKLPSNDALKLSNSQLLARSINEYHDHIVKKRGIEMMMWSDMLEGRHKDIQVGQALDLIPKDIIMVSWNYTRNSNYPWPKIFKDKGFRVIVSPFKDLLAAELFLKQAKRDSGENLLGVLYTTWTPHVVTDLSDALIGKANKARLDPEMVEVAKTLAATIYLFK